MLSTLKSLFQSYVDASNTPDAQNPLQENLIAAILMIEVMKSDHHLDAREEQEFLTVLSTTFGLDEDSATELHELATSKAEESTSLFEFTAQINAHFSNEAKLSLIKNMWRIAFADGEIDRYEDGVIRQVSELIYVSHSDFIRMKIEARDLN